VDLGGLRRGYKRTDPMNSGGSTAATRVIMWRTRFNESYGVSDAPPVCAAGST